MNEIYRNNMKLWNYVYTVLWSIAVESEAKLVGEWVYILLLLFLLQLTLIVSVYLLFAGYARKVKVNSIRSRLFNFFSINMENKFKCFRLSFQLRQLLIRHLHMYLRKWYFTIKNQSYQNSFANHFLCMYVCDGDTKQCNVIISSMLGFLNISTCRWIYSFIILGNFKQHVEK